MLPVLAGVDDVVVEVQPLLLQPFMEADYEADRRGALQDEYILVRHLQADRRQEVDSEVLQLFDVAGCAVAAARQHLLIEVHQQANHQLCVGKLPASQKGAQPFPKPQQSHADRGLSSVAALAKPVASCS